MRRKLVLGGGGPAGAAWLGALTEGLLERQVELRAADELLGTSAGAVLGAWLSAGEPLARFAVAMRDRAAWHASQPWHMDRSLLGRMGHSTGAGHPTEQEIRHIAAQAARSAEPRSVAEAAAVWSRWLPDAPWPAPLRMVCADAATGRPHVWGRSDGLALTEGIAATTAAPGAAAPVLMRGRTWVDGGVRSSTNADLITPPAPGAYERVLILAPLPNATLDIEVAGLRRSGADVTVVTPDERTNAVLTGGGDRILDPEITEEAARAAKAQAEAAAWLRDWWNADRRGDAPPDTESGSPEGA
ncbi:patatin-like phospholipase family protein [Actinoallomurus rhizosphaericola]|uniref:patatin-like phospholipase family protein n=1 Tax=Actinoallomurus rhizosphaericola TaxID=2952536 RepID=UPI002093D7D3|nr:patatin-like phospholipase family protein [Actinoallomurus rhizosphaericola]MCO5998979.1 patatin-like phospholipase family protein [Actinoallomurus rhizosphaericola]